MKAGLSFHVCFESPQPLGRRTEDRPDAAKDKAFARHMQGVLSAFSANPPAGTFCPLLAGSAPGSSVARTAKPEPLHRRHGTTPYLTGLSHFLGEELLDGAALWRQKAHDTLRKLEWRAGDTVYVALDDTQQRKRGRKMDAVKKLFLHAERVYAPAHIFLTCMLIYCGVVIPYAVRLWLPQEFSRTQGVPGRKLTDLAAYALLINKKTPDPLKRSLGP